MSKNCNELIDKTEYYNILFDYYEELFTEKQKEYFRDYYFFDLSLSEIALNYNISRSAVFDAINKMHNQLDEYEKILSLYKKDQDRLKIYNEYETKAIENNNQLTLSLIKKLKENE